MVHETEEALYRCHLIARRTCQAGGTHKALVLHSLGFVSLSVRIADFFFCPLQQTKRMKINQSQQAQMESGEGLRDNVKKKKNMAVLIMNSERRLTIAGEEKGLFGCGFTGNPSHFPGNE